MTDADKKISAGKSAPKADKGLSVDQRIELAKRISQNFSDGTLNEFEQKLAHKIFMILASDTELKVRQTLSERVKNCHELPHDIAIKLANDVIEVAEPILSTSRVLTDEDLVEIIKTSKTVAHKLAISVREKISPNVSKALVDTGEVDVIRTLVANNGAEFTEQIIMQVLDNFSGHNTILETLVKRGDVPLTAVEKMVSLVSDELRAELVQKYSLDQNTAGRVVESSREIATLGLMSLRSPDVDLQDVVDQLYKRGQLTPSLVLRSLCVGDISFFQHALARMAGIPMNKAKTLLADRSDKGFKALYRAANMPMGTFEAVRAVLLLALEETDNGKTTPEDYQCRMMERIYENGYTHSVENMSYIMGVLSSSMQAAKHAVN